MNKEIQEAYTEDTYGRKYHKPTITPKGAVTMRNDDFCGEVQTYNFNRPLSKDEWKKLPDDLKRLYIQSLRERFAVTNKEIAATFGMGEANLYIYLNRLNLKQQSGYKRKKPKEKQEAWERFLNGETETKPVEVKPEKTAREVTTIEMPPCEWADILTDEKPAETVVCKFSFEQVGAISAADIAKYIQMMIPNGTKCRVSVNIETVNEGV